MTDNIWKPKNEDGKLPIHGVISRFEREKLKVRILPNQGCNPKWYYKSSNSMVGKELVVKEYDDEPVFTDSYIYTDSLFITKSDCVVVNVL